MFRLVSLDSTSEPIGAEIIVDTATGQADVRTNEAFRAWSKTWLSIYKAADDLLRQAWNRGCLWTRDQALTRFHFLQFLAFIAARHGHDRDDLVAAASADERDQPLRWLDELNRLATTLTAAPAAPPASLAVR
jgi:hypothetical protein